LKIFVIPELQPFLLCHPGNRVSDYPGSSDLSFSAPGSRLGGRDDITLYCHPGTAFLLNLSSRTWSGIQNSICLLLGPGSSPGRQ